MISRSKKRNQIPEKIGTIGDLVNPDLLQLLENSTQDKINKEKIKKVKIRIKKK